MAHDKVNVVWDDFCFEEGMTKEQIESKIADVSNYTELTYAGQEDVELPVTSDINGNISTDFVNGLTSISGTATGNQDGTDIGFEINTNAPGGLYLTDSNAYPYIRSNYNNNTYYTKEYLNTILAFKNSMNYTQIKIGNNSSANIVNFIWDMAISRKVTFNYRLSGSGNYEAKFYGSNDNVNWALIHTYTYATEGGNANSFNSTTAYRYYKVEFITDNAFDILYMYLSNVEDSITKKKNKFTLSGYDSFSENQSLKVKTPAGFNLTDVVQNSINNETVNQILNPSQYYNLVYNNEAFDNAIDNLILDITLEEDVTSIDISGLLDNNGIYLISVNGLISTIGDISLYTDVISLGINIAYLHSSIYWNNIAILNTCNNYITSITTTGTYCSFYKTQGVVNLDNLSIKNSGGYIIKSGANIQIRRLD